MRARRLIALAAVPMLLASTVGIANADDISNRLDDSVDAVAEVMPLNVGGTAGSTQLYLIPKGDDGKNGCNLTGSTTLTLAVSSSDESVATVSPSSVTFGSCGDTKTLTITPVAQGSATISVSQTTNTTAGSFDLAPATFTVNVAGPANTAPQVSVAGVAGGASYSKGSVPAATCQVTDSEDGSSSFAASLSAVTGTYASDGIGSQTASCSYTDKGGLTAVASETYSIVDPSAPVIDYTLNPADPPSDADGWYRGPVTLTWSVSDPQSPNSLQTSGCVDQTITADQAATTYSCSASSAGGSAGPVEVAIKKDATAPLVSYTGVSPAGPNGSNDWYTSPVTAAFTGTDALSGPASATKTVTSTTEGAAVTLDSPAFTDAAGNTRAAGSAISPAFKIDSQAPNAPKVSVSPTPNAAGWHKDDVTVSFENQGDNGASGVDVCTSDVTVSTETTTTGRTVSGTCTDLAGNESAAASVTIKLDKTGPVVSQTVTVDREPNSAGWYDAPVDVTFTATDVLSGLDMASQTVTSGGEGNPVTVDSPAFTDRAGNTTAAGVATQRLKIDVTDPSVPTFTGGPTGTVYYGYVPAAPTCSSSDALSGLKNCAVTGYATGLDTHTMTATATDNAGNTSTATRQYTVAKWTTSGFYSPVDMGTAANPVLNTIKAGSTVPLKFELFAGPTELTNVSDIKSFTTGKITCNSLTGAATDEIEVVSTGGTSLRYDTAGGQFIQNWKTPTTPGTCYRATMTAQDGSVIEAFFKTR